MKKNESANKQTKRNQRWRECTARHRRKIVLTTHQLEEEVYQCKAEGIFLRKEVLRLEKHQNLLKNTLQRHQQDSWMGSRNMCKNDPKRLVKNKFNAEKYKNNCINTKWNIEEVSQEHYNSISKEFDARTKFVSEDDETTSNSNHLVEINAAIPSKKDLDIKFALKGNPCDSRADAEIDSSVMVNTKIDASIIVNTKIDSDKNCKGQKDHISDNWFSFPLHNATSSHQNSKVQEKYFRSLHRQKMPQHMTRERKISDSVLFGSDEQQEKQKSITSKKVSEYMQRQLAGKIVRSRMRRMDPQFCQSYEKCQQESEQCFLSEYEGGITKVSNTNFIENENNNERLRQQNDHLRQKLKDLSALFASITTHPTRAFKSHLNINSPSAMDIKCLCGTKCECETSLGGRVNLSNDNIVSISNNQIPAQCSSAKVKQAFHVANQNLGYGNDVNTLQFNNNKAKNTNQPCGQVPSTNALEYLRTPVQGPNIMKEKTVKKNRKYSLEGNRKIPPLVRINYSEVSTQASCTNSNDSWNYKSIGPEKYVNSDGSWRVIKGRQEADCTNSCVNEMVSQNQVAKDKDDCLKLINIENEKNVGSLKPPQWSSYSMENATNHHNYSNINIERFEDEDEKELIQVLRLHAEEFI